jgi:predicted nucleic acid-binding protein
MTGLVFVDTNVLIYAATPKSREPEKGPRARAILANEALCLSAQVLQEFFVNVVRKARRPISVAEALAWIERLQTYPCAPVDSALVRSAIWLSERYRIAYWDAAILAAAERLGADVVYSEDLSHGQAYGPVRVENPFA